jgi:hypothetical protein
LPLGNRLLDECITYYGQVRSVVISHGANDAGKCVTITYCDFSECHASGNGGAVSTDKQLAHVSIRDSTCTSCTGAWGGRTLERLPLH